jgi:hypothetical protein
MPIGPDLHMTVAVAPTSQLSVATEIRLVKAALLYSDRVTLASGVAAMIDSASRVLEAPKAVRARRLLEVASVLLDPEQQQLAEMLLQRRVRRKIPGYASLEAGIAPMVAEVEGVIGKIRDESGMSELQVAVDAGLLEIDTLGLDPIRLLQNSILAASGQPQPGHTDEVVSALVTAISNAAIEGARTYPLFDEGASSLISTMIREGHLPAPNVRAADQAALAGRFVGYVPAFPEARIDEIIDVRRGLQQPLVGFRAALAAMARTIEDAPWDPGFGQLADDAYRIEVAPAIAELEEAARDMGAVSLLRHAALSRAPWASAGAVIGLALAAATVLPDVAAAALAVGAPVAAVTAAAVEMAKERMRLGRQIDRNRFLFLYQAGVDLGRQGR